MNWGKAFAFEGEREEVEIVRKISINYQIVSLPCRMGTGREPGSPKIPRICPCRSSGPKCII
jgi:hypothetical protein